MNQTTLTTLTVLGISATSLVGLSTSAMAAAIGVDWTTGTTGTLNTTTVTLTNIGVSTIFQLDLSGPDFSAAPLSSSQEIIGYPANNSWTANFSSSVSNLLFYPFSFRGSGSGGPNPTTYTFNQSFTILSGLTGASVVGNTLILPQTVLFNGVIQFNSPVSSLSVTTSATSLSQQGFTFGVNETTPPPTTPEPSTLLGLIGVGLLGVATRKLR